MKQIMNLQIKSFICQPVGTSKNHGPGTGGIIESSMAIIISMATDLSGLSKGKIKTSG